jgi:predicted phosphodiesterase
MLKFIITGDWHLRPDNPVCRKDNFFKTQYKTLEFIKNLAIENNAGIINTGDIFHKPRYQYPDIILNIIRDIFKNIPIYYIAGNHDLLFHNLENIKKGNIGILSSFKNWYHISKFDNFAGFDYGKDIENTTNDYAVIHKYTSEKNLPFFIKNGITSENLSNYDYKTIFAGDNHEGFMVFKNNTLIVNPGCITRQTIDKKNYKPRIYIYDTKKDSCVLVYLPDNNIDDIDSVYIDEIKNRENRIDSFVEKLKGKIDLNLSFEDNIKKYIEENNIQNGIKQKLLECIKEN